MYRDTPMSLEHDVEAGRTRVRKDRCRAVSSAWKLERKSLDLRWTVDQAFMYYSTCGVTKQLGTWIIRCSAHSRRGQSIDDAQLCITVTMTSY